MLDQMLFKAKFTTGQTIRLNTASGMILDSCAANIGVLQGKVRTVPAILCDGASDTDQWQVLNIVNETGLFLDHVAIKGAVSDDQAHRLCKLYLSEARHGQVRNQVPVTTNALKTFLDSAVLPSNTAYFLQADAELLDVQGTVSPVVWDEENALLSHGGHLSKMMLDMANCDLEGNLLEQVTPRDIAAMLIDVNCQVGMGMFDAMIIKYNQFEKVFQRMAQALKASDNEEFFVKSVTPIEPFKRMGVVNVGVIFEMSDTQTITLLFNNPDTTPSKLTGTDILTSWKWILNKRDVTAILQPRAVDARKYPQIASRMLKLLARNHDRFKRAQAAKNKDELLLAELVGQVEAAQVQLSTLQQAGVDIQSQIDAETIRKQQADSAIAANLQTEIDAAAAQAAAQAEVDAAKAAEDAAAQAADKFHEDLKTALDNPEEAAKVAEEIAQVPELTGDEFGEFDLDMPEGKEALRESVKKALLDMRGKYIQCPALNSEVEIRKSGIKKIMKFSADVRKLQAMAALDDLIGIAALKGSSPSHDPKEKNIVAYHTLRAPLTIDEKPCIVQFIIREDDKGNYHYDHTIGEVESKNAKSPLLDGLNTTAFPTAEVSQDDLAKLTHMASCLPDESIEINQPNVNMLLDSLTGEGAEVLNMFIEEVAEQPNEQIVQMNNNEQNLKKSVYVIKNPKPRTRKPLGTVTINVVDDAFYSAFVSMDGVGGEYVGDLDGVKNWLTHRLTGMGEAMSDKPYSFADTAAKLSLEIGQDVLGVNDISNPYENASLLDLSKGVVSELVALGWEKSGSTAIKTVEINNQPVRLKFQFDPFAKGVEIWISRDDGGDSIGRFGMPDMSEMGIKEKAAEMNEAVTEFVNNQSSQSNEQNVQLNIDEQQFLNDVIASKVDLLAEDTGNRIEQIGENLDPSLEDLFEQAIEVYSQAALKNAQNLG